MHSLTALQCQELIYRLPRSEANAFLTRLAQGEAGVQRALLHRLNGFLPQEKPPAGAVRSFLTLCQRARQIETADQER
ncbi:MAG: hypothetical protein VB089_09360 [Anaerolineaceae bacterium]|nr:hypothetical protein [Anaerolineaceae bacterium]